MKTYRLPTDGAKVSSRERSVALGLFDGIHIGHRAVVAAAKRAGHGHCAVYTFSPSTMHTKPDRRLVATPTQGRRILSDMGVSELFETDFSTVCHLTPEAFVQEVLQDTLHATSVTCGFNYRFGKGGVGDTELLGRLCAARGIAVTVVPAVTVEDTAVSSTAIRKALDNGDMASARRMLGRGYSLSLPVTHGQHLGGRLGMPTINQILPTDMALPRFGVYASCVQVDDQTLYGVTNIGIRPTVGAETPLAETWLDGYEGDLYGKTVTLWPIQHLRDEQTFDDLDGLRRQVSTDAARARALFHGADGIRAVLFDFDETLHIWNDAFSKACDKFLYRHYPTLSPETHAERLADMLTYAGYGYHMPCAYPMYVHKYLHCWEPINIENEGEALHEFLHDFATSCVLLEDVIPTLQELRRRGYRLGVVTNGGSFLQNSKVDYTNLRPYIDLTVVSGDEGVHKPSAELFRRAAARLGVPCEACLYVGDHPVNDIGGAIAADMVPIRVDYGFPTNHPAYDKPLPPHVTEIHRLSELLTLPSLCAE